MSIRSEIPPTLEDQEEDTQPSHPQCEEAQEERAETGRWTQDGDLEAAVALPDPVPPGGAACPSSKSEGFSHSHPPPVHPGGRLWGTAMPGHAVFPRAVQGHNCLRSAPDPWQGQGLSSSFSWRVLVLHSYLWERIPGPWGLHPKGDLLGGANFQSAFSNVTVLIKWQIIPCRLATHPHLSLNLRPLTGLFLLL